MFGEIVETYDFISTTSRAENNDDVVVRVGSRRHVENCEYHNTSVRHVVLDLSAFSSAIADTVMPKFVKRHVVLDDTSKITIIFPNNIFSLRGCYLKYSSRT
jgi:hypothetical protein